MAQPSNRKGEKSLKDAEMPPLPFAHQIQKGKDDVKKDITTVSDALKKIDEMRKFCDSIDSKFAELCQVTGWSPEVLESQMSRLSPVEWERFKKERTDLMASIMLPEDLKKYEAEESKAVQNPQAAINDPKLARERRKKGAGVRRKWLPVK